MKRLAFGILTASLFVVALAGCGGKGTGLTTGPSDPVGTVSDLQRALAASYPTGAVIPTNAELTSGLLATVEVDARKGATALYQVAGNLVDAGAVTVKVHALGPAVSELALDKETVNVTGALQYFYSTRPSHPLTINLNFDGNEYHRFMNSGSGVVAAFSDSVKSVVLPVLSAPGSGGSVVRTSALPVSWTPMGVDSTVYVIAIVRSKVDSTKFARSVLVRDTDATVSIAADSLASLPLGAALLAVARFRLTYTNHGSPPVVRVGLVSEAVRTQDQTIN